jgi:putative SOS response-associated peptidase YedK
MCGRFTLRTPNSILLEEFQIQMVNERPLLERFNVAPTQDIPVVRDTEHGRELTWMRWGLIPSWAKDPKSGPLLINARAETAAEKPAFRSAFKSSRCLIPADGFYEWKKVARRKQPYHIRRADGRPFAFAGLWSKRRELESCTILTTDANELVRPMHDRMPVILSPGDYANWLDLDVEDPHRLMKQLPASEMVAVPVNPIANNARNEGADCVEPLVER